MHFRHDFCCAKIARLAQLVEQPVYTGKVRSSSLLARTRMDIKILYEDEYVLALNKPSGILVHSDGKSKEKTLSDWVRENYPTLKDVGEPQTLINGEVVTRPGIVHRLDRDTSGVIIVAKTKEAHAFLKGQFQNREVQKIYHAVVHGKFSEDKLQGVIDKPIGRSTTGTKWSAEFGAKGEMREALTEYRVVGQQDMDNKYQFAYLEVMPKTGRTHQIRVHLKSISHPVICDKVYGTKDTFEIGQKIGFSRLALHAYSISLKLPNNTFIKIDAPLPEEFEKVKLQLK